MIPPSDSRAIPSLDAFRDLVGLLLTTAASLIYEGRLAEAEEFLNLAYLHKKSRLPPNCASSPPARSLHRAYKKLGVSGRHDLAEALRDHPAR
jgi:hypothetical protein